MAGLFSPAYETRRGEQELEDQKTDQAPRPGAQDARCFGFAGPHYIAAAAVGNARRGGAMDRADFAVCTRRCSQRSPAPDADPERRMRAGRNVLGRVLFGDFLLHEQEKVTRSSAGRVGALALE